MRYWGGKVLWLLAASFFCHAEGLSTPNHCGKACRQTFRTLRFADAPPGVFFTVQECTSLIYQTSLHLCWEIHCAEDVWRAEAASMNQTCHDISGSYLPAHSIINNLTDHDIEAIPRFNATSPDRSHVYGALMLPSQSYYDLWVRTLEAHDYIWGYHSYYGWAMGIFWALVIGVGIANRALAQSFSSQGRKTSWARRNILIPATLGRRCVQDYAGWGTLPPRIQTLTLILFVMVNIACTLHGYDIFEGYGYYPSIWTQVLRHVSDRTGILSFANFPLIWLFGMRNNIVIWLTGWDFKTYNNFHRWVGRIATLQAVIHSIGYTIIILQRGGWKYFCQIWTFTFWWTGELATILICLLVGLSVFWVRRENYEFFLITHIILSFWILVTMLGHVSIFSGAYDPLVWVPALIWLLDRVIRGLRIMALNPKFWDTKALITYNEDAHMIRVTVPTSSSLYKIEPGTFYYIMVLNQRNFWESHPFTVATISGSDRCDTDTLENAPLLNYESSGERRHAPEKSQREMTFLIRPYDSFTSRLREFAEEERPRPATVCVAIDGPYGKSLPLERFTKVLFIVGGSGIAVPLSYLYRLTTSSTKQSKIEVHWAVRQSAFAIDVLNHDLSDILGNDRVEINIYLTTGDVDGRIACDETIYRLAKWNPKRLNIEEIIGRVLEDSYEESIAVVTSGPAKMADESRSVVAARTVPSLPRIEYFEESFQW
ncbi:ferric-chelate reductase [Fusarium pseudoanthophilum]|uniref:Ferric-chelate reductase n=1 Tax=Fusarium pseudoanthophilum TaxID=48495 RepID=A0A8H5L7D7_9HYPO|nr:ferric-chelate reductase [Fusarium pseudoanthophilum]